MNLAPYAKAVIAFIAPAAVTLTAAVQDGTPGGSGITASEWVTAACACIITSAAVWAVPNATPKHRAPDQPTAPYTGGH